MHTSRCVSCCAALAALAILMPANADIINVPADHPTIQGAITLAMPGDEVVLAPGIYHEQIFMGGREVTLRSIDPEDPDVVAATILDGQGTRTVLFCQHDEDENTHISGLTITGGHAEQGGGMRIVQASPRVTLCTFRDNTATLYGGGLSIKGGVAMISRCTFVRNSAGEPGSGGSGGGIAHIEGSNARVSLSTFIENTADYGGGTAAIDCTPITSSSTFERNSAIDGGAIWRNTSAWVTDSTLVQNIAENDGGAIWSTGGSGVVSRNEFRNNHADGRGGAIFNERFSSPTMSACVFIENHSVTGGGAIYNGLNSSPSLMRSDFIKNSDQTVGGGAIFNDRGNPVILDGEFIENEALGAGNGGAILNRSSSTLIVRTEFVENCAGGNGGAIANEDRSRPDIQHSDLVMNNAGGTGGGVCNIDESDPEFLGVDFRGNTARTGGALYNTDDCEVEIQLCAFADNQATAGNGGAVASLNGKTLIRESRLFNNESTARGGALFSQNDDLMMYNCTIYYNQADEGAGVVTEGPRTHAILCSTFHGNTAAGRGGSLLIDQGHVLLTNCILWGNTPPNIDTMSGAGTTVRHSNVDGFSGRKIDFGNISIDPLFVNPIGSDGVPGTDDDNLRLGVGSACIDAGDSTQALLLVNDIAGNPRHVNAVNYDDIGIPNNTGLVVDMGAYEADVLTPTPCIGDTNGDSDRDLDDLQMLLFHFGSFGTPYTLGDGDGDGDVDMNDLQLLLFHFGTGC